MEPTIVIAGIIGMLALVKTGVDYLREVVAWLTHRGSATAVLHRTIAFLVAVGVVFLYGASQLGDFEVPGTTLLLADMNGWTKLVVGLAIGGLASLTTDYLKARDNTQSAVVPPLLNPPS